MKPSSIESEIEAILQGLKFTVLNRKVTEKDWEAEVWFDVTKEAKSALLRLIAKENAKAVERVLDRVEAEVIGEDEVVTQRYSGGIFVNSRRSMDVDVQRVKNVTAIRNRNRAEQRTALQKVRREMGEAE